jgi:bifunctional UDP-N-acetylglucosamine pyrophosphorylase / glucosamine-1-phosphate N-acetyltransferase
MLLNKFKPRKHKSCIIYKPTIMDFVPVIMAGGMGKRMRSDLPKVLHLFMGEPMLVKIIRTTLELRPLRIVIIVGIFRDIISKTLGKHLSEKEMSTLLLVDQPNPQGTGHAVQCAERILQSICYHHTKIVILSGDVPLISTEMIHEMRSIDSNVALAITEMDDPTGYGRIVIDDRNQFSRIVEQKDCNEEEKDIKMVNCGLYMFSFNELSRYLPLITNENAQKEYYLTDLFYMLIRDNVKTKVIEIPQEKQYQLQGVNTPEQLAELQTIAESDTMFFEKK